MANALAIAGVTAILKDLLNDGLINQDLTSLGEFEVTARPPERIAQIDQESEADRLNLFLYRVTPNPGWINQRLPSRSSRGDRQTNPYLALDLHYLLTAYGSIDLNAEVLLGYGMHLLHETPVLVRERIRDSLDPSNLNGSMLPTPFSALDADALAEQFEQIRISPEYLDTEEFSRLWSSLNVGARMSAAYQVSVVLIESRASTRVAPPVQERKLYVPLLHRPRLVELLANPDPGDTASEFVSGGIITHGQRLALVGTNLRGDDTAVELGEVVLAGGDLVVANERIEFDIPAALWPGIYGLQVLHRVVKEAPAVGLIPLEFSNNLAFALSPSLSAGPDPGVELLSPDLGDLDPDDAVEGVVRIRFAHQVGVEQEVELLLNEVRTDPPANRAAFAHVFPATPPDGNDIEVSQFDFAITGVTQAIYLVRVLVDGTVSDVGVATGPGLPPDIQVLADLGIYSSPVLDLRSP